MRALVAGRAVLPDDVCDQLGGGGGHAAAVAALQPTEPVDQFLRARSQQKLHSLVLSYDHIDQSSLLLSYDDVVFGLIAMAWLKSLH